MQIVKADFTLKKVRKRLLQNNQVKDTTTFKLDNLNSFNHSSTLLGSSLVSLKVKSLLSDFTM